MSFVSKFSLLGGGLSKSLLLTQGNGVRCQLGSINQLTSIASRPIHTTVARREIFKIQDENDFNDKVLRNKNLVILDFYATWCGPCRLLTPRLENVIGTKMSGEKVDLAKVDVDELEDIAGKYDISSIPVVFAIKDGQVINKLVGLRDEDQLAVFIERALGK